MRVLGCEIRVQVKLFKKTAVVRNYEIDILFIVWNILIVKDFRTSLKPHSTMDVFSTPALSFHPSENQETIPRKIGPSKILQRKPFLDRPVNSRTPLVNKLSKEGHSLKQQTSTPTKEGNFEREENLNAHEFKFSYKDLDEWPKSSLFGTEGIIRILDNYCNNYKDTPPPSPITEHAEMDPVFFNFEDFSVKETEPEFFESIDEIDVPQFEESFVL